MKNKQTPFKIEIRFSDCDIYKHVNNAVYLTYFEQARIHYFGEILGENWDWTKNGVILKTNTVEYLLPLTLQNKALIYIYIDSIGKKSFTLSYKIFNEKNELTTTGSSTLIAYNYDFNKSIEIDENLKNILQEVILIQNSN